MPNKFHLYLILLASQVCYGIGTCKVNFVETKEQKEKIRWRSDPYTTNWRGDLGTQKVLLIFTPTFCYIHFQDDDNWSTASTFGESESKFSVQTDIHSTSSLKTSKSTVVKKVGIKLDEQQQLQVGPTFYYVKRLVQNQSIVAQGRYAEFLLKVSTFFLSKYKSSSLH